MINLTDRQVQILKTLIEEYIETAAPVASETLDKKYNLGVSPATIRNEMVKLIEAGFLKQPHSSAGRVPTSMALKFYINQLMKEKELSVADEVTVKERIWDRKHTPDLLLREAAHILAEKSTALSVVTMGQNKLYHAGYANILDAPEFFDIDVAKTVFSLIDDFSTLEKIFALAIPDSTINILVGNELEQEYLEPCGMVFAPFQTPQDNGYMAVLGSRRLHYNEVIPFIKYVSRLVEEAFSAI